METAWIYAFGVSERCDLYREQEAERLDLILVRAVPVMRGERTKKPRGARGDATDRRPIEAVEVGATSPPSRRGAQDPQVAPSTQPGTLERIRTSPVTRRRRGPPTGHPTSRSSLFGKGDSHQTHDSSLLQQLFTRLRGHPHGLRLQVDRPFANPSPEYVPGPRVVEYIIVSRLSVTKQHDCLERKHKPAAGEQIVDDALRSAVVEPASFRG